MTARVERNPVMASFWQFNPTSEDPEVEAMAAALSFVRSESDRVNVTVRGKPRRHYELGDSVWLEFEDAQAIRFIARMAATLGEVPAL
jgi:hypothetical protein